MNPIKLTLFSLLFSSFSIIASEHRVISTENIKWGMLNPLRGEQSPKAADLWGDRSKNMATGMLVKFKKGFSSPPHIHNISYRGIVITGLMHNDDPNAEKMWLPAGSFWTQPAGENHITAANEDNNLIYLEIDAGPYLVQPANKAFDNGERPINIDARNLIWLSKQDAKWINTDNAHISYLWGKTDRANGSFIKLPANFKGNIVSETSLKAVVIKGKASYRWNNKGAPSKLSPSSFFSSKGKAKHHVSAESETVLYINSDGKFWVE